MSAPMKLMPAMPPSRMLCGAMHTSQSFLMRVGQNLRALALQDTCGGRLLQNPRA